MLVGNEGYSGAAPAAGNRQLTDILVARCDDMSDELSLATLTMFHRLLASHSEEAFWSLVLSHVAAESVLPPSDGASVAQQHDGIASFKALANRSASSSPRKHALHMPDNL